MNKCKSILELNFFTEMMGFINGDVFHEFWVHTLSWMGILVIWLYLWLIQCEWV